MTIPDADGVIHGCRDPRSGALSVIDSDTQQCPKGAAALNWSQTGPQGPAGPRGPAGPQGPAGVNHGQFGGGTNIDLPLGRRAQSALEPAPGTLVPAPLTITSLATDPHRYDPSANFIGVVTITVRNTGTAVRRLAGGHVDLRNPQNAQAMVSIAPGDVATMTMPMVNETQCWDHDPATNDTSPLHVIAYIMMAVQVTDVYASVPY
jgi:hypothetical protein